MGLRKKAMHVLRDLLRRKQYRHIQAAEPAEESLIEQLPPEMLLAITKFLPLHTAALLTLTSKTMRSKIGDEYLHILNMVPKVDFGDGRINYRRPPNFTDEQLEYKGFLSWLAEELPNEVFCHICQSIHDPIKTDKALPRASKSASRRDCICVISRIQMGFYFNFPTINLAMKRARHGLDPSKQLSTLSQLDPDRHLYWWHRNKLTAKIIKQRMYVRIVHRIPVFRKTIPNLPGVIPLWDTKLCRHLHTGGELPDKSFNKQLTKALGEFDRNATNTKERFGDLFQCRHCLTEFCIEVQKGRGEHDELVITVWQDYGRGEQPFDLDFCSHFISPRIVQPVSFPRGSIRDTFEMDSQALAKVSVESRYVTE